MRNRLLLLIIALLLTVAEGWTASVRVPERFILILSDPPVAGVTTSRNEIRSAAALSHRARIEMAQQHLREELERRNVRVTGAVQTVLNAVFVEVPDGDATKLQQLPGVARITRVQPVKLLMNKALDLMNVPQAWNAVGGEGNAGAKIKIGIIDTGIDQNHPALQDSSLQPPPGYPRCIGSDCSFTSKKVIVARSYVGSLVLADQPDVSRPDDLSPRDRVGHGTAVAMIAAGKKVFPANFPNVTLRGVAPKAFLGNYKIFGSPGVNDITFNSTVIQALEDAFLDGMDIVTLSLGSPGLYGPLDQSTACGGTTQVAPCDAQASAVENAVSRGMMVVAAAGNDGASGSNQLYTYNSINSPGTAPSAITVGATTNAHVFYASVFVNGDNVPSNLANGVDALFGDGPRPTGPVTAPLRDVTSSGNDGMACAGLPKGSLTGTIALIQRGNCAFAQKVNNAQAAGAVSVILYQADGLNFIFPPSGLLTTGIPMVFVGNSSGVALKNLLGTNPNQSVTLDPTLIEFDTNGDYNGVLGFSSRGPSIGEFDIKPELVATGTDILTATQTFDPNGDLWDPSGYTSVQGTSFAVPMTAGAAALVMQNHPNFTTAQIKSALVNTADPTAAGEYDQNGNRVSQGELKAIGAGLLNVANAVQTVVTVVPPTLSYGALQQGSSLTRTLSFTNNGPNALNLTVTDMTGNLLSGAVNFTLNSGSTHPVQITLPNIPPPGAYEGWLAVQGTGGPDLHVPYQYLVTDGTPADLVPVLGNGFTGVQGDPLPFNGVIGFKAIDRYGVPVPNVSVNFSAVQGGGFISQGDPQTDIYGIAAAQPVLGSTLGDQIFRGSAGGLSFDFVGTARQQPAIAAIVNGASFEQGKPGAPGSYVSIFGADLADTFLLTRTVSLPVSLAGVSVSFDKDYVLNGQHCTSPLASGDSGLSQPGHVHFVSPGQINVQVPWEFQATNSTCVKISIGDISSGLFRLGLSDYAPALFVDANTGLAPAQHANYQYVTQANPAKRGETIILYANGVGPLKTSIASGEPAPASPLIWTQNLPTVTIGGKSAHVQFSGLSPGFVGLYQLNVDVPPDAPSGLQQVVITNGGVSSKPVSVPIQ